MTEKRELLDVPLMERMRIGDEDHYTWCDFCLMPLPEWALICDPARQTSRIAKLVNAATPNWACCGQCLALIMSGRWDEVAQRTLDHDVEAVWALENLKVDRVYQIRQVHETCYHSLIEAVPEVLFTGGRAGKNASEVLFRAGSIEKARRELATETLNRPVQWYKYRDQDPDPDDRTDDAL